MSGTFALVPRVVDAFSSPPPSFLIVAAGGIMNRLGLVASLFHLVQQEYLSVQSATPYLLLSLYIERLDITIDFV
ncbi:MAG TPA: hypothetical protein VIP70_09930 [Nitrososphaeraceae archaeon]